MNFCCLNRYNKSNYDQENPSEFQNKKSGNSFFLFDASFFRGKTAGLLLGGSSFIAGCVLSSTGAGLPASILMNAGFGSLFDACTTKSKDYSNNGNLKQFVIGGIAGSVMSSFQALAFFPAKAITGKIFQSCATNLVGYSTTEALNSRLPTFQGTINTLAGAGITPVAGNFSKNI